MAVAVSPDGARLALMTLKGEVEVWDAAGGGRIRSLREDGHVSQIVAAIAFSVDGGLATGFGKSIARWTAGDFRPLPDVATHATVHSIAYSGDGRWLACSEGNEVWLRRADGEEPRRLLQIERGMASSLAFSPDHRELLACGDDSLCRFLDVETGDLRMVLRGHRHWVNRGIYSPDGKLVLTGSDDQTARLWDPETGRQLRVMKSSEEIVALGFSPDGKWLFFNDHSGLRRLPAVPGPSDSPAVLLERAERSAGLRLKGLDLVAFE